MLFDGMNRFSFELFLRLLEQQPERDLCLSPANIYLPLALLRSTAGGATRAGLTTALRMNELLTEEERQQWVKTLVSVLSSEELNSGVTLLLGREWKLSPAFLERTREVYQATVSDEHSTTLQFRTYFKAALTLATQGKEVHKDRTVGICVPTTSGKHALTVLIPSAGYFWQNQQKRLLALVRALNEPYWQDWQGHFQAGHEAVVRVPTLQRSASNQELFSLLEGMNLGPGVTPSADYSPMMASGDTPYLTGLRHNFSLRLQGQPVEANLRPLVWILTDVASGLILALGLQRGGGS